MDVNNLLQAIVWGISNGAVFALIALGYTLVYGIIDLINFAHGDVFMLGSFLSLSLLTALGLRSGAQARRAGWQSWEIYAVLALVLLAAMLFCAVLNAVIERLAYRPLRRAPRLAPLISAIGVSFMLVNVGLLWKGPTHLSFPSLLPDVNILTDWFHLPTVLSFTTKDLAVIGVAVPLMLGLAAFIQRTKLGKAMRATAQDREAAALMGINIDLTISLTFLLGGALAGASGLIYGLYFTDVHYQIGFRNGLIAFTAAVLGGIGNVRGAALGGFLIGLVASVSDLGFSAIFPALRKTPVLSGLAGLDQKWTLVIVFGLLIVILVFRPTGLLGEEVVEKA
jgi:branched-chain amino acid transport system permease protein